ncbi:MAG: cobalamin-binding protein [candidate division Zixibacteria bacterium]|nr:cobalamin-binding protein [candidate division Zixibacteria bacterium]
MEILKQISESLEKGDFNRVGELTQQALDQGLDPKVILDDGLIAGMSIVGQKFKVHEIFLPDVLLAAKAMYAGMDLLKPLMIKENIPSIGKVVMGTVQGDLHDIGKNLVSIMLKGAGLDVIDLGNDVPPAKFVDTAISENADVIGISTLLTTTMPVMGEVVEMAKERGVYGKVKIIVGGAPLNADYAEQIGADAYCFDGVNAVDCVKRFLGAG